jgi:hypothetical protein
VTSSLPFDGTVFTPNMGSLSPLGIAGGENRQFIEEIRSALALTQMNYLTAQALAWVQSPGAEQNR